MGKRRVTVGNGRNRVGNRRAIHRLIHISGFASVYYTPRTIKVRPGAALRAALRLLHTGRILAVLLLVAVWFQLVVSGQLHGVGAARDKQQRPTLTVFLAQVVFG